MFSGASFISWKMEKKEIERDQGISGKNNNKRHWTVFFFCANERLSKRKTGAGQTLDDENIKMRHVWLGVVTKGYSVPSWDYCG